MAEAVISLITAVITIADACAKTCDIISERRDAPAIFATIAKHLDLQLANLVLIRKDLEKRYHDDPNIDLSPLLKIAQDCKENIGKLQKFVDTCNVDDADRLSDKIKKNWKMYVKNEGKSAGKLAESVKQSLGELFQNNMHSNPKSLRSELDRLDEFVREVKVQDEFEVAQEERSQYIVNGDHNTQNNLPNFYNGSGNVSMGPLTQRYYNGPSR